MLPPRSRLRVMLRPVARPPLPSQNPWPPYLLATARQPRNSPRAVYREFPLPNRQARTLRRKKQTKLAPRRPVTPNRPHQMINLLLRRCAISAIHEDFLWRQKLAPSPKGRGLG